MEGIPTGVDFLDAGPSVFFRSKPYLAFGASGTGKSILGLQYVHASLLRGESALYVCREKAEDLIAQAERLGLPLARYVDEEALVVLEYDEGFRDLVTSQGPESVLEELCAQVDAPAIRRVVLDPVDPFFSSLDDESLLRGQLRSITEHFEERGWTPLLLCDDGTLTSRPFVLRVFSEVCWGLFELQRDADEGRPDHSLLVYKLRNVDLPCSRFAFRIGHGGIASVAGAGPRAERRPTFARFRGRPADPATSEPEEVAAPGSAAIAPSRASREAERARREPSALEAPVAESAPRASCAPPAATDAAVPAQAEGAGEDTLELLDERGFAELERRLVARRTAQAEPEPARKPDRQPLALVIDSDPASRAAVARALGNDMEVYEAPDGLIGLRAAAAAHPDLLVVAAAMPRLNGIGLCRILRDHGVGVPVLFLCSAEERRGTSTRALLAGGDEAFPKPVDGEALRARALALLQGRERGGAEWPVLDVEHAPERLGPQRVEPAALEPVIAQARQWARQAEIPLCLLGYEFRFVEEGEQGFVEHFLASLARSVRAEDVLCRAGRRRIVALLVDTDDEGARAVVKRVHQQMAADAARFIGDRPVKPKALYRLLTLQPRPLAEERTEGPLCELLFRQPSHLIEEDRPDRPGDPVERYPLLEAIFASLTGESGRVVSPLDGSVHPVETHPETGVRETAIDGYCYRTQDPRQETPAGFRAARGARIVWVENGEAPPRCVARIEEGRVFRGRAA